MSYSERDIARLLYGSPDLSIMADGTIGCPLCWECYGALITETDRTPLHNISSTRTFEGEYIVYYQPLRGWDQA